MSNKHRGQGGKADSHPDLIAATRDRLRSPGVPYVIENVPGAKRVMRATLILHGGLFDLGVHRPRLFEMNCLVLIPLVSQTHLPLGVYGNAPDGRLCAHGHKRSGDGSYERKTFTRAPRSLEEAQDAMGIDWMTWEELREAIPPAYTEYIGHALLEHLERAA